MTPKNGGRFSVPDGTTHLEVDIENDSGNEPSPSHSTEESDWIMPNHFWMTIHREDIPPTVKYLCVNSPCAYSPDPESWIHNRIDSPINFYSLPPNVTHLAISNPHCAHVPETVEHLFVTTPQASTSGNYDCDFICPQVGPNTRIYGLVPGIFNTRKLAVRKKGKPLPIEQESLDKYTEISFSETSLYVKKADYELDIVDEDPVMPFHPNNTINSLSVLNDSTFESLLSSAIELENVVETLTKQILAKIQQATRTLTLRKGLNLRFDLGTDLNETAVLDCVRQRISARKIEIYVDDHQLCVNYPGK